MRRTTHLGLAMLAVLALFAATAASASAHPDQATHLMKVKQAHNTKPQRGNNLAYRGGAIERAAKVYVVYWVKLAFHVIYYDRQDAPARNTRNAYSFAVQENFESFHRATQTPFPVDLS